MARRDDTVSRQLEDCGRQAVASMEPAMQRLRAVASSVTREAKELSAEAKKHRSYPRLKAVTQEDLDEYDRQKRESK